MTDPPPGPAVQHPRLAWQWLRLWVLVLAGHAVAGAAWWWLMPHGFPAGHPRFWANEVMPIAVPALAAVCLVLLLRRRHRALAAIVPAFPCAWAAAAVVGRVAFPTSLRLLWLLPLFGAALLAYLAVLPFRGTSPNRLARGAAIVMGTILGALLPWTQRAPDAATVPQDAPLPAPPEGVPRASLNVIRLAPRARVQPNGGVVTVGHGRLELDVSPLLTFISRSPDRCWTIFSPRPLRVGPARSVVGIAGGERSAGIRYADDDISQLDVRLDDGGVLHVAAFSRLPEPVYSHLNSFTEVTVMGHRRLAIAFSPVPGQRFDVTYSQYPVGLPARFACLDADGSFRVLEASSGEKGPFRPLGSGAMKRGEPLALTLFDEDVPVSRLVLEDWSAQVSTQFSPTAGWGVPANAIVFSLYDARPISPAGIWIDLASTGVGRGWDSVGHAAGTYRNRVTIEPLTPVEPVTPTEPLTPVEP